MIYVYLLDSLLFQDSHEKERLVASPALQPLPAFQTTRQLQGKTLSRPFLSILEHILDQLLLTSLLNCSTPSKKGEVNKLLNPTQQRLQLRIIANVNDYFGRLTRLAIAVERSSGSWNSILSTIRAAATRDVGLKVLLP